MTSTPTSSGLLKQPDKQEVASLPVSAAKERP